ncbi:MAG: dihydropteroate synthase, partial [Desulfobacterales bacterium]
MVLRKTYHLSWPGHTLSLGRKTCIMGVVNVTPDSFSDGGHFYDHSAAVAQGEKLAADGADIIDIGG